MNKKFSTFLLSLLGGLSIAFGIVLANNMNHVYLSPLMFSLGIVFTIIMGLELITRAVPIGKNWKDCVIIGAGNFVAAMLAGFFLKGFGHFPDTIPVNIWGAIGTGIIIGLVSVANKKKGPYTVPVTFMLMFSFVYLKLPHCVVSAFYLGGLRLVGVKEWLGFLSVLAGNIIGGLIVYCVYRLSEIAGGDALKEATVKKDYSWLFSDGGR